MQSLAEDDTETFAKLLYALRSNQGAILLTGEAGCGKTMLSRSLVAELEPGDVLYNPPFWLHHVRAASNFSASISIWTPSAEARAWWSQNGGL